MTDQAYGCQGLFELGTLRGKPSRAYDVYNETLKPRFPNLAALLQFTSTARECSISGIRSEPRALPGFWFRRSRLPNGRTAHKDTILIECCQRLSDCLLQRKIQVGC